MSILDDAKAQGREIVTRDGRRPLWVQATPNYVYYHCTNMNSAKTVFLDGRCNYEHNGDTPSDLILAPKKATIWYVVHNGAIAFTGCGYGDERPGWTLLEGRTLHSVTVDLP